MGYPARRALAPEETKRVLDKLESPRDRALFLLGIATGYRISELLSLRIKHVYEFGRVRDQIAIPKVVMKGKKGGRSCWLHPDAQVAIRDWLEVLGTENVEVFLFRSKKGYNQAISRAQAWRVLKQAFAAAEVGGETGTHSLRKTYAQAVHALGERDLYLTQQALGHDKVTSTAKYLANVDDKLKQIITGRKLY